MGLTGRFSVQASGMNLQYQWSRNGSPISGANASTYTTPATTFSDSGSNFTVAVSNPAGSAISSPASLTVTARAPKEGDLRFQQVDASSTVNGYTQTSAFLPSGVNCPVAASGGNGVLSSGTGTSFFLSNTPCSWQYMIFDLPVGAAGLQVGYFGGPVQGSQATLHGPFLGPNSNSPDPSGSNSVVIALDVVPSANGLGFGFVSSATSSGFDRTEYTVPSSGLQALVTQEGLRGRVITAVGYDGTQATAFSYGWTGDPSTVYEAKVVFATIDTVPDLIQGLAAEGYIITATGSTEAADGSGVILIGTRIQGDTMARPVLVVDGLTGNLASISSQGYALVAVVQKYQNNVLVLRKYIGER